MALTITIPAGVLVGILIGLSRLAADSEITAMRASGLGVWHFLRIISIFVVVAWALALLNGVFIAPRSQAALGRLEDRLKSTQVSFEIQPNVFYEGFPKMVVYVRDVHPRPGASEWAGVFLADITDPAEPRITMAESGIMVGEGPDTLHLHLTNGSTHETIPGQPDHYQISTFSETDIPIALPPSDTNQGQPPPVGEMSTRDLWEQAKHADPITRRWDLIEFNRRLALSTACVVLALVGIPLGLSSKKGGKSAGFVLTILLVFVYYSIPRLIGVSFAREGRISPALGVWPADILFLIGGGILLWRVERRPIDTTWFRSIWRHLQSSLKQGGHFLTTTNGDPHNAFDRAAGRRRVLFARFPMLLDDLVLRDFALYLMLILGSFLMLLLVFTLFELIGDILRNGISPLVVGEYLLNVTPFFIYNVTPLSMLLAVLITFGLMTRSNASRLKATGISIYRIIIPVLLAAAFVAAGLFVFDQFYLPRANKRQDALRNLIKGKPAQTYLLPDRKWIKGRGNTTSTIGSSTRSQRIRQSVGIQYDPGQLSRSPTGYTPTGHIGLTVYKNGFASRAGSAGYGAPAIEDYHTFDVSTFAALMSNLRTSKRK